MQNKSGLQIKTSDETASRKDSHLDLALSSQTHDIDSRFYYEPMIASHPDKSDSWETQLGNKKMRFPVWISSMTGGTEKTNEVNRRLARTARKFGLGMGVGSARIAVEDSLREKDFALREFLGDEVPFYLNFGIAQIERFIKDGELYKLKGLLNRLEADGFIIHVNPLQEWMQPEGDKIENAPIVTVTRFMEEMGDARLIVKEVGQGFGPESMRALLSLPLMAIEFAAAGGTNFSKIELKRNDSKSKFLFPFVRVGNTAEEMVDILNRLVAEMGELRRCDTAIVSGGIKDFLDGFYYIQKSKINALYGQASGFLKYALESQEALDEYARFQTEGLLLARTYLKIKEE